MRTRILFSHKLLLFCIVTLSLLFSGVSFNVAEAVSTGTVDFRGSEVSSNIPAGAHYQHVGNRKVSTAYLINILLTYVCKQEGQNLNNFQHNIPIGRLNAENPLTN